MAENPFQDELTPTPTEHDHSDDLARQFKRVVMLADTAWEELAEAIKEDAPVTRAEARYKDWASVLLRYHDAMERVSGKDEGPGNLGGMKAGGA